MKISRFVPLMGALSILAMTADASSATEPNRSAPSVHLVTSPVDGAPGSLRQLISVAAPGDVITFAGPMTVNLGSPIIVGVDNLTIEACYPDVTVNALGLFPGIELSAVTGCHIRGLRMEGFNPAIGLTTGAHDNHIGGPDPCDLVEIYSGGLGVALSDPGTVRNKFVQVQVHHNMYEGIYLRHGASENFFGDGTPSGAVISSDNGRNGVLLEDTGGTGSSVIRNEFHHCLIGLDPSGLAPAGNALSGVVLDGPGVIENMFSACVISGNSMNGVTITGGANQNTFWTCLIGVDASGTAMLGNVNGVEINAGSSNAIEAGVVSGNQQFGVVIRSSAAFDNKVNENRIGPDANAAALGNGRSGVALMDGAFENRVIGNHISSNGEDGVALMGNDPVDNLIESNLIGTDQSASAAMPNARNGIFLGSVASSNDFRENIVSGNADNGVAVVGLGSDENSFQGNIIGLDSSLANAIPNGGSGMLIYSSKNLVGGVNPGDGNYICANTRWGVEVRGPAAGFAALENEFYGNTVGMAGLGNGRGGLWFDSGALDNFVGNNLAGNTIHENGGPGVLVHNASTADPADGNHILSNSITANAGDGIELAGGGNCMIPAPIITAANSVSIEGYTTVSSPLCTVQVFRDTDDEGMEFLGEVLVASSYGFFSIPVTLSPGDRVTATQTADIGCTTPRAETSPFSSVMTASEIGSPDCFCPNVVAICGNPDPNAGCANSTGSGALLKAHGTTSVASDDLTLSVTQVPRTSFTMLLGSRATRNIPFRDGRLCVGGSGTRIWRFQLRNSGQWGASVFGAGIVARSLSFSTPSGYINSGNTWYFQTFYRDTTGPCGTGGNLTNNVKITFTP